MTPLLGVVRAWSCAWMCWRGRWMPPSPQNPEAPVIALTPRGAPLNQTRVAQLADGPGVTLLCGRFEGIDERLFAARPIEQVSIGRMCCQAANRRQSCCSTRVSGCCRASRSAGDAGGREFRRRIAGISALHPAPGFRGARHSQEVLLSGDHARIAAWRKTQAEERTRLWRPDLWEAHGRSRMDPPPSGKRR